MNQDTKPTGAFIPFALPALGPEEENAVLQVLRSGWLTTGSVARRFENEFARALSVRHALAVNSCTSGLHLALEVLGVGEGDWVVASPYTFTATVEIARYLGAHPLFVDIEEHSLNIDPSLVEKAVNANSKPVKCVIPVHLGGLPCDMKALGAICSGKNIPIVEDAAHAFPCETNSGPAGTVGAIGVFSFYATKTITTGEGGMLVTNSDDIAQRAGALRLHGIDREVWGRYQSSDSRSWEYDVIAPGYKYNMPDINAAVGIEQLRKATDFRNRRAEIAEKYLEAFAGVDFITPPALDRGHSWHLFVIGLNLRQLSISRNEYLAELADRGIGTSVHYKPLHLMSYYRQTYGLKPEDFPNALRRFQNSVSLPIYPLLTDEQIDRVIDEVVSVGKKYFTRSG